MDGKTLVELSCSDESDGGRATQLIQRNALHGMVLSNRRINSTAVKEVLQSLAELHAERKLVDVDAYKALRMAAERALTKNFSATLKSNIENIRLHLLQRLSQYRFRDSVFIGLA